MNVASIYNEIHAALQRGERVAVATVVKTIGAAPCGVGEQDAYPCRCHNGWQFCRTKD